MPAAIPASRLYFATRGRSGLDLPAAGPDREVRDERVSRLPGPVRDHLRVARHAADGLRLQGLADGADLVDLDQGGVADSLGDRVADDDRAGHQDVVANQLHRLAEPVGEPLPASPVVLGEPVLDAPHGEPGTISAYRLRLRARRFRDGAVLSPGGHVPAR